MTFNFHGMLKAPMYHYEVSMERKRGMNAVQNARRRIAYVRAPNDTEARKQAERDYPEFKAGYARRV